MGYVDLTLAVAACYQKNVGTGAMIASMLPSRMLFLLGWTILFYLWVLVFGLPMGPRGCRRRTSRRPVEFSDRELLPK